MELLLLIQRCSIIHGIVDTTKHRIKLQCKTMKKFTKVSTFLIIFILRMITAITWRTLNYELICWPKITLNSLALWYILIACVESLYSSLWISFRSILTTRKTYTLELNSKYYIYLHFIIQNFGSIYFPIYLLQLVEKGHAPDIHIAVSYTHLTLPTILRV